MGRLGLGLSWLLLAAVSGCSKEGGTGTGTGTAMATGTATSASASASAGAPPVVPEGNTPKLPPLETIKPTCCWMDRAEGVFGPDKGVNARYSGDYLKRKDGERLLFPDDLISDTKELYQFARSAGKPLYQERRLKVVGEWKANISVEIEDRGETGATMPFAHSKCRTIELRTGKLLRVEDVAGNKAAPGLLDEAKRLFNQAPDHDQYLFVPTSFAVLGPRGQPPRTLRFCNPRRNEKLGAARLDIELPFEPDAPR